MPITVAILSQLAWFAPPMLIQPSFSGVVRPKWGAALAATVIAGLTVVAAQVAWSLLALGEPASAAFRPMAATLLGAEALDPAYPLDQSGTMTAIVALLFLSAAYGVIVSHVAAECTRAAAPVAGMIAGALIYLVDLYGFPILFPWIAELRSGAMFASHLLFGVVLAALYKSFEADDPGR